MAFEDGAQISVQGLYETLMTIHGPQGWWPAETAFEMMVGAILTQNTAWTNVERALLNFKGGVHAKSIVEMPLDELVERIRPTGFFNQKAERLKILAQWFLGYGETSAVDADDADENDILERIRSMPGDVLRLELLALKGIGPETADSILLYALDKPYFVIDAYTKRIFKRLGFCVPGNYDEFRHVMESLSVNSSGTQRLSPVEILRVYNEYHALLVRHAKDHCRNKPICKGCLLSEKCEKLII